MAAMASTKIAFLPRAIEFQSRNRCSPLHCDAARRQRLNLRLVPRAETQIDSSSSSGSSSSSSGDSTPPQDDGPTEMPAVDPRRGIEKFVVRDLGKYKCRSCGYVYDQASGDPSYPVPPGVEFVRLPDDWRCSTCGAAKSYFDSISVEIPGFAENQNFGIGTNTLTSGQKSLLIYGSLALFFFLFLSGYFLQ